MGILDLSTQKPERNHITVDGVDYELAVMDDLAFKDSAFMSYVGRKAQGVEKIETWTDEFGDELEEMIYKAGKIILPDMPDEVYNRLTDNQRLRVIQVFSEAEQPTQEAPQKSTE